jgi:hypothetical protein
VDCDSDAWFALEWLALSMAASAYTSPQPVAGDGFESWRPGATHLTAAIMAKQHLRSQTFYLDCYQREKPAPTGLGWERVGTTSGV